MVLCILVFIPDLTVYSASLFVLCMISSCAFVAGQCYNRVMAWGRLLASLFVLLPVEEIGQVVCLFVFGFISQHGSVCLTHSSNHMTCVDSLISDLLYYMY